MNRKNYEFVKRGEYSPVKVQLNEIIQRVKNYLLKNTDITFEVQIVGSGKKHLITREVGGNKGFDFDFNLVMPKPDEGYHYEAKIVNDLFIEAFRYAVKGTGWNDPEDSTSVLTIKTVDREHKRIVHSCDFAIVYYDSDGLLHYRHHHKENGGYGFQFRPYSDGIDERVEEICSYSNGWNLIRDKYLQMKNSNRDVHKKSFMIYIEAVNAVYNEICEERDEDDDSNYDDD